MPTDPKITAQANFGDVIAEITKVYKAWQKYDIHGIKSYKTTREITKELDKAKQSISRYEREINDTTKAIATMNTATGKATIEFKKADSATAKLKQQNQQLKIQTKQLADENAKLARQLKAQALEYVKMKERVRATEREKQKLTAQVRSLNAQLKLANTAIRVSAREYRKLDGQLARTRRELERLKKEQKSINTGAKELLLSWKSIIRIFAVQLAHQAVSALVRALAEGVRLSVELEQRLAEVMTIQGTDPSQQLGLAQWAEAVKQLSDASGLEILDIAEAAYQTLSNQVGNAASSLYFLDEAMKFAIVTHSSLTDSVSLGTSVINAYGYSIFESKQIFQSLFETIRLGRVRTEEIANIFGRVAVVAKQLGIELVELQGMLTEITIRGLRVPEALTQIRGLMIKLLKPSTEMKKLFRDLGVESSKSAVAAYGWVGLLDKMSEHAKGLPEEMIKLVNRIRGYTGFAVLAGDGTDKYREAVEKLGVSWEDAENYAKGQELAFENAGKALEKAYIQIKNYFTVDLGRQILLYFNEITDGFQNAVKHAKAFVSTMKLLAAGVAAATILTLAYFAALPTAIAGAVALILATYYKIRLIMQDDHTTAINQVEAAYQEVVKAAEDSAKAHREAFDALKESQQDARQEIVKLTAEYNKSVDSLINKVESAKTLLQNHYKSISKAIKDNIKDIEKEITDLTKTVVDNNKIIKSLSIDSDDLEFGWDLDDASTEAEKFKLITDRIYELTRELGDLAQIDTFEEFGEQAEKIKGYYDDLYGLDIKRSSVKKDYLRFIEDEISLREGINEEAEKEEETLNSELSYQKELLTVLNSKYEIIKKLNKNPEKFLQELSKSPEVFGTYLDGLLDVYNEFTSIGNEVSSISNDLRVSLADIQQEIIQLGPDIIKQEMVVVEKELLNNAIKIAEKRIEENERVWQAELHNAATLKEVQLRYIQEVKQAKLAAIAEVQAAQAFSGGIGFAAGSMGPVGSDSVNAMLTPGETVINASASKKWAAQLMAMNQNRPIYRAEGGPVGKTYTFGDINISPQATGSHTMDVLAVGRGLKTAIRRKQIDL